MIFRKSPNSALIYNPQIFSNFLINNRRQNLNSNTVTITSRYWGHFHETNWRCFFIFFLKRLQKKLIMKLLNPNFFVISPHSGYFITHFLLTLYLTGFWSTEALLYFCSTEALLQIVGKLARAHISLYLFFLKIFSGDYSGLYIMLCDENAKKNKIKSLTSKSSKSRGQIHESITFQYNMINLHLQIQWRGVLPILPLRKLGRLQKKASSGILCLSSLLEITLK